MNGNKDLVCRGALPVKFSKVNPINEGEKNELH